ncbi:FabD/lysophospholipase-like protein [Ramaria rubella]|nr:FabD/lysophospholipase-like protein [Ramaria rubella]
MSSNWLINPASFRILFTTISSIISTWTWPSTLPFSGLQAQFSALLLELGCGPGSLYSEIVDEQPDPLVNPECEWDAEVRLGDELCLSERAFLRERKRVMKAAFAKLMNVPEEDVFEDDLPVVAIAGSGGGYRAMLNTIGSLSGAQGTGLLDCVTYTAGISGSCWSLGLIHSGVAGSHDPLAAGQYAKERIQLSYLDTATLEALITPPTNKYLLSGIFRKAAGPSGSVSLVDLYGTLVSSRIFVPSDLKSINPHHISLHSFRQSVDNGSMPLPIFTALQRESETLKATKEKEKASLDTSYKRDLRQQGAKLEHQARWLWYEFTPFEVGCDELGAWIPAWALGRQFRNGKSLERRPELSFTILSGIFASAFCATLKDYFKEIQPSLRQLPPQLYGWLEEIITENEEDLGLIHPVLPNQLPNFLNGLLGQLREGSPVDITQRETLGFMVKHVTAELNIPYYPLLRRNIDCIIALDASADSQVGRLHLIVPSELAAKRGLRTWPRGARWPARVSVPTHRVSQSTNSLAMPFSHPAAETANLKLAETQEDALAQQANKQSETDVKDMPDPSQTSGSMPLNSCEVWIGTSKTSDSDTSRLEDLEEDALSHRDGIGIVYMPLVPNEKRVPNFDPFALSTWRREFAPEESQKLLDVAEANFMEGTPKVKKLLRAIWLRKKREREARESQSQPLCYGNQLKHAL